MEATVRMPWGHHRDRDGRVLWQTVWVCGPCDGMVTEMRSDQLVPVVDTATIDTDGPELVVTTGRYVLWDVRLGARDRRSQAVYMFDPRDEEMV